MVRKRILIYQPEVFSRDAWRTSNQRHLVDNQNHLLIYGFSCNESQRMVVVDKSSSSIGGKLTTGVVLSHLPRQELCGEYVKFLFIRR